MNDDGNQVDTTTMESNALRSVWENLGPLFCFAIRELGREDGLALCNGLASGSLLPTWILRPGLATCKIWKGDEVVYSFEFTHKPARFVFAEIGKSN